MKISLLGVLKESNEGYVNEQGAAQLIKGFTGDAKAFRKAKGGVAAAFEDVLSFAAKDNNQIKGYTKSSPNALVNIDNLDDLLYSLRNKGLDDVVLAKFNQGLLKSSKTPMDLIDGITIEVVGSKNFVSRYGKLTDGEMRKALKAAGYSDSAVESFMKNAKKNPDFKRAFQRGAAKRKRTAGGKDKNMSPKGNGSNVPAGQKKTLIERANEIINMIKVKKMSWKELSLWAAGIGVGALALWWFLYDSDEVIPEDTPETEPGDTGEWAPCIKELLDSKEGTIMQVGASNLTVVRVVTPEYPEGLNFVSNGRVADIKTRKMGTWKCKGTEAVIAEQSGKVGLSKIDIKWDGESGSTETPPKSGGTGGGVSYHDCSSKDFPFEFGCISPKIAEIQGCLGITPQKGYFGPKTRRTMQPTYDLSGGITKEIYDAVKAKCGKNEPTEPERKKYTDAELSPISRPKISDIKPIDTSKLGDLSGKIKPIETGNQGESIYKMLQSNYGDGSNPEFPYIFSEGGRLKYKGELMGGNAKDQLSQYVGTLGYREEPIKDKDKSYGVKYVWVKE
jgi:hypothetical protein